MKRYRYSRGRKGFTLVEILVVVAILASLAATMWVSSGYFKEKELKEKATHEIQLLETALKKYAADNGDLLPYGRGDEYSSHVLYETLYGDTNNSGEPDEDAMPYCNFAIIQSKNATEKEEGIPAQKLQITVKKDGKSVRRKCYLILDPWGNPYRYRLGHNREDEKNQRGSGINAEFDIFSQGPDGLGDGKTNDGDNADNISNIRSWK